MKTTKPIVDIATMVCLVAAIISGVILHTEIHHTHVYNDLTLWTIHCVAAIAFALLTAVHAVQHGFWFRNYGKIPMPRKVITTLLLLVAAALTITGAILLAGSHSNNLSITHYVLGLLGTALAAGHVAKRIKLLKNLLK
jgi:CHASE3 domain sensor protein